METGSLRIPQADKEDLDRLRLTCKHLGDMLEAQVLHTIYFSVQGWQHPQWSYLDSETSIPRDHQNLSLMDLTCDIPFTVWVVPLASSPPYTSRSGYLILDVGADIT